MSLVRAAAAAAAAWFQAKKVEARKQHFEGAARGRVGEGGAEKYLVSGGAGWVRAPCSGREGHCRLERQELRFRPVRSLNIAT